jgi:hypothetical protein
MASARPNKGVVAVLRVRFALLRVRFALLAAAVAVASVALRAEEQPPRPHQLPALAQALSQPKGLLPPGWQPWQLLFYPAQGSPAASMAGPVAVTTQRGSSYDVFATSRFGEAPNGAHNAVIHRRIDHTQRVQGPWEFLPSSQSDVVTVNKDSLIALARTPETIDIFAIGCWAIPGGCRNSLVHWSFQSQPSPGSFDWFSLPGQSRFSGPERISGRTEMKLTRPAATSWSRDRLDVFAYSVDGRLLHFWSNTQPGPWSAEALPAPTSYPLDPVQPPAALAPDDPGHVDVFVTVDVGSGELGERETILEGIFHGRFLGWHTLGCILERPNPESKNPPSAVSWGFRRSDLFVHGKNGICHWWADGGDLTAGTGELIHRPTLNGGQEDTISPPVVAASPTGASGRLDLFAIGEAGRAWHLTRNFAGWEWDDLAGAGFHPNLELPIAAASSGPGCLAAFAVDAWFGSLHEKLWELRLNQTWFSVPGGCL